MTDGSSAFAFTDAAASTDFNRAAGEAAFEEAVTTFFLEAADLLGVPKSVAAIYATCFASAVPLSFSDIQARVAFSAGSVSQGLKVLRAMGALKVVRLDEERREFFEPDFELRKLVDKWIEERLQRHLGAGKRQLQVMGKILSERRSPSDKVLKDRIKHLQKWHNKAATGLPLLRAFLKVG